MPSARALLAALLAASLQASFSGAADGQETPRRPGDVTAAENVEILTLDVLALDKKDRPVFGLTSADFEVKIAGKVQTLEFFEAPGIAGAKPTREGRPDSEERIAGTTTPFTPGGATVRHVLFYVDLEQLSRRAILEAAGAIHKALEHPAAGRYGLATHLGPVSARVWDADSADAIEQEADAMAGDGGPGGVTTSGYARGPGGHPGQDGPSPVYEERQISERVLIDNYVFALCSQGIGLDDATRAIASYLSAETRRVTEGIRQLRETCERFAALDGPRHLIVISEGYERVPGYNFLLRLQTAIRDGCSARGGSLASPPAAIMPGLPGADKSVGAGRFGAPMTPVFDSDELTRWLASSGVTVHYVDPGSLGRDLSSAEDRGAGQSRTRAEEHKNLQDAPLRLVDATGGLARVTVSDLASSLETLLDATSATYRLGVRLAGVDTKKTYSVKVSVKKPGVSALARSSFRAAARNAPVSSAVPAGARKAALAAAVDEKRPGAMRLAKKTLPLTLDWKGRSTLASKDPTRPFWKLEVRIPHEALSFKPDDDAMLASVQIVVEAASLDGPLRESVADDWVMSYTGPEYQEARDTPAVRTVTLQLPPGKWELKVSAHDALGDAWGTAVLRIDASR